MLDDFNIANLFLTSYYKNDHRLMQQNNNNEI